MSEENLSQTVVIPHIDEEKVSEKLCDVIDIEMEMMSVTPPNDSNNGCSKKQFPQEIHLQSCVLDRSKSKYEELESFMSKVDASMQDFDDINSIS